MTTMPPHMQAETRLRDAPSALRQAGYGLGASINPPNFPKLRTQDVSLSAVWYRPRSPWSLTTRNLSLTLAADFGSKDTAAIQYSRVQFSIGGLPASLTIPSELILRVLDAFGLPRDKPLPPETITLLLEYRLSEALDALEQMLNAKINIDSFTTGCTSASEGFVLHAACVFQNQTFHLALAAPPPLANLLTSCFAELPIKPVSAEQVLVRAALRIGSTKITLRTLKTIRLNDVILIDAGSYPSASLVIFGERHCARATFSETGWIFVERPAPMNEEQKEIWSMTDTSNHDRDADIAEAQFDDIQVRLVFEIGRREVSLGDMRRLSAGHVFDLGRETASAVDIFAGARRIGHGEIVQINETLGVRVTRLFGNE